MTLRLTVGFSDNPRVEPLKDGTVKPQNIELGFVTRPARSSRSCSTTSSMSRGVDLGTPAGKERPTERVGCSPCRYFTKGHVWPTLTSAQVRGSPGSATCAAADQRARLRHDSSLMVPHHPEDLHGIEARTTWFNGRTKG
jgi:hypothetical protein